MCDRSFSLFLFYTENRYDNNHHNQHRSYYYYYYYRYYLDEQIAHKQSLNRIGTKVSGKSIDKGNTVIRVVDDPRNE